jgi:hypothetical protein
MPYRASDRQPSGPARPRAPGSIASAGSRTPSRISSLVTEARSDSFRSMFRVVKPGVPRGTTKPRTPSSARAHTTATSAKPPLVIHIFVPSSTQSSPSRRARVRIDPGSEPESGSVSPKQPIASPAAIRGSHSCFCSSLPYAWIAYIASDPCTLTRLRRPESTASSSRQARPYWSADAPGHP